MNRVSRSFSYLFLILFFVCCISSCRNADSDNLVTPPDTETSTNSTLPILKTSPDFNYPSLNGRNYSLSDLKGHVSIIDFWATWCGPCKIEIPSFIALRKKYSEQDLIILGVSVDDEPSALTEYMKSDGATINYPILEAKNSPSYFGSINGIPTTFLIDRQGRIRAKHVGVTSQSEFESEINTLLNEPK